MNKLQIHGLCDLFIIKAQINYMWSLKKFKMREILCMNTFDI
jgi:hypothetical protein